MIEWKTVGLFQLWVTELQPWIGFPQWRSHRLSGNSLVAFQQDFQKGRNKRFFTYIQCIHQVLVDLANEFLCFHWLLWMTPKISGQGDVHRQISHLHWEVASWNCYKNIRDHCFSCDMCGCCCEQMIHVAKFDKLLLLQVVHGLHKILFISVRITLFIVLNLYIDLRMICLDFRNDLWDGWRMTLQRCEEFVGWRIIFAKLKI